MSINNFPPFYTGQKIVCVAPDGDWYDSNDNVVAGPKNKEVVTCVGCYFKQDYGWAVNLLEYPAIDPNDYFDIIWKEKNMLLFVPVQNQKLKLVSFSKVVEEAEICVN